MNFMEILRTAAFALRGNWMRSALTSLGVIIGIAAVIVMVSVGQGTQAEIDKLVSGLGSNRLDISSGSGFGGGGVRLAAGSRFTLSVDDADAIRKEIPEVQYVAASLRGGIQVVSGENNWSTQWQGVQPDWFDINDWIIASGQPFEARDYSGASKSVILGDTVRQQLFGDQDAVGQTVRLGRVPFAVIATLKPKGQGGFGQDQDDLVVVPLETARRRLSGATALPPGAVQQVALGVGRAEDLSYAQGEVEALLRQRHRIQPGDDDDFNVRNISEIVATRTQTTRLMSLLLGAVAGISLVVGGIGIMNIMLVSVTERTREIGIRLAIGALAREVRLQFLMEAVVLCALGGLAGIALGFGASIGIATLIDVPFVFDPMINIVSFVFAASMGIVFGYYPAHRASQLDPIEALRHE